MAKKSTRRNPGSNSPVAARHSPTPERAASARNSEQVKNSPATIGRNPRGNSPTSARRNPQQVNPASSKNNHHAPVKNNQVATRSNPAPIKNNPIATKYKLNRTELEFTYEQFTIHLTALRLLFGIDKLHQELEITKKNKLSLNDIALEKAIQQIYNKHEEFEEEVLNADYNKLLSDFNMLSLELEFNTDDIKKISDDVLQKISELEGFESLAKFLPKNNLEFDPTTKKKFFTELHVVIEGKLKFLKDAHGVVSGIKTCKNDLANLDNDISNLDNDIASLKNAPKAKMNFQNQKNKIQKTLETQRNEIQKELIDNNLLNPSELTLGQLKKSKDTVSKIQTSISNLRTKIVNKVSKLKTSIANFINRVTVIRTHLTSYNASVKKFDNKQSELTTHVYGEKPTYKTELDTKLTSGKGDIINDLEAKIKSSLSREISSENEITDTQNLATNIANGKTDVSKLNDDQLNSILDVSFSEASTSLDTLVAKEEKVVEIVKKVENYEKAQAEYNTALRNIRLDSSLNSSDTRKLLDENYFTPEAQKLDTVQPLKLSHYQELTTNELNNLNIDDLQKTTKNYQEQTTKITNFLTAAKQETQNVRSVLKNLSDIIEKDTEYSSHEALSMPSELSTARKQLDNIKEKIDSIYNISEKDLPYLPEASVKSLIEEAKESIRNNRALSEKNKLYLEAEALITKIETAITDLDSKASNYQIQFDILSALKKNLNAKITEKSLDKSDNNTASTNLRSFNTFIHRLEHWPELHEGLSEDIQLLKMSQSHQTSLHPILVQISNQEKKLKLIQEKISNPISTLSVQDVMNSIDDAFGEITESIKILEQTIQLLKELEASEKSLNNENPRVDQQKNIFSNLINKTLEGFPITNQDIYNLKKDIQTAHTSVSRLDRLFKQLNGLSEQIKSIPEGISTRLNLSNYFDEINKLFKESTEISPTQREDIAAKIVTVQKKCTLVPKIEDLGPLLKTARFEERRLFNLYNKALLLKSPQTSILNNFYTEIAKEYRHIEAEIETIIKDLTDPAGKYGEEEYKKDYAYIQDLTEAFSKRVQGIIKFNTSSWEKTENEKITSEKTENERQIKQPFVSTTPSKAQEPKKSSKTKTRIVEILEPEQLKRPNHTFSQAKTIGAVGFLGSSSHTTDNKSDVSTEEISLDEILKLHK